MIKKNLVTLSIIFLLVGFMIALQFRSVQQPEIRDTRELFEVREELKREQQNQEALYMEIEDIDQMFDQYTETSDQEKIDTLKDSVDSLKVKAGLTELKGEGLVITIKPIFLDIGEEIQKYPTLSSLLLSRLINELNNFGASHIAIENERYINVSPIRNVNGQTYINNRPIPPLPVKIYVLSENPSRLLDYLEVSESRDIFAIENLEISSTVEKSISLPKYEQTIDVDYIHVFGDQEEGGR